MAVQMDEVQAKLEDLMLLKGDPYRDHLYGDSEKHTVWRLGAPPRYELVNKVFESGRTKEWKKGSLEEIVQNLVKTWEMELTHKTRLQDFKTIDVENFSFSINGSRAMSGEEVLKAGSYNALLASIEQGTNPIYKSSMETFESSHEIFHSVFPQGFAWEVLEVYSGPPTVAFKWRHWGTMGGSFKGHKATGQVVELVGIAAAKVNEELKIRDLEVYYDPTQFLDKLSRGGGCPYAAHSNVDGAGKS